MKRRRAQGICVVVLLAVFLSPAVLAKHDRKGPDDWKFTLSPYLWATGIDGKVIAAGNEANPDLTFGDLLENFDGGLMVHYEMMKRKWIFGADYAYLKLTSETTESGTRIDTETKAGIGEVLLARRFGEQERPARNLDVLGGFRFWDLSADIAPQGSPSSSGSENWTDLFVGVRYTRFFQNAWNIHVRGDIGGFDVGNSSDFTWNFNVGAGYDWSLVGLYFGYRILDVDFEDGSSGSSGYFKFDARLKGPYAGALFHW